MKVGRRVGFYIARRVGKSESMSMFSGVVKAGGSHQEEQGRGEGGPTSDVLCNHQKGEAFIKMRMLGDEVNLWQPRVSKPQ